MSRPGIEHQPALDGLRGIAVAAVLCFHGGLPGAHGGYLGVSVFFTISGFLITSLLLAEHHGTGEIRIGAFYARRARRLLPASLLCLTLIAIAGATTTWFDAVATLRRDLLGALFQVANWVFLAGGGSYQELLSRAAGQVSPLEHYWSLAIEEQFYWLWPVVLYALVRRGRRPNLLRRVVVLTTVLAASAPLIAWHWGGDAAYWATPARIAEILAGAVVAVAIRGRRLDAGVRWCAAAGSVLLGTAIITFPAAGGPAYAGALPLVGAASGLLILGLQVASPVRDALSWRPLTWLGSISYGVYLYHWPIFLVVAAPRVELGVWPLFALRMAITLILAQVSYLVLEQPVRRAVSWPPSRVGAGAALACGLVAATVVLAVPGPASDYWRTPSVDAAAPPSVNGTLAPLLPSPSMLTSTTPTSTTPASTEVTSTAPAPTSSTLPTPSRPVRILVVGDSTAEATGNGLAGWAVDHPDLAQVALDTEPGCGFLRGGDRFVQDWEAVPRRCGDWLDHHVPATLATVQPDVVIMMTTSWDVLDHRWDGGTLRTPFDDEFAGHLEADIDNTTAAILAAGAAHVVWVREPVPNVFWWSSGQTQEDPARHDVLDAIFESLAAADSRVSVADVRGWLDGDGLASNHDARPDGVHWSPDAARLLADELLGPLSVRVALTAG